MKIELVLISLFLVVLVLTVAVPRLKAQPPGGQMAGTIDPIDVAREDIERDGWHLVLEAGENSPGVLYSVGLWKTYQHPEVFVSATGTDPRGLANSVSRLIRQIAEGQTLKEESELPNAFGSLPGAVRPVQSMWVPTFLKLASEFYGSSEFPVLQVFWPDAEGVFPWQRGFDPRLFPRQPLLFESNLVLANLGLERASSYAQDHGEAIPQALDELFVEVGGDALGEWDWLIGAEAELFRATIFGDVFFSNPDGTIHWLDAGYGETRQVAPNEEGWLSMVLSYPSLFFKIGTLWELRAIGRELDPGDAFDWIKPPLLGGEESPSNVQVISARVHIISSARTARRVLRGEEHDWKLSDDPEARFAVVVNEDGQYSMWPEGQQLPDGWRPTGMVGDQEECMDYIAEAMGMD